MCFCNLKGPPPDPLCLIYYLYCEIQYPVLAQKTLEPDFGCPFMAVDMDYLILHALKRTFYNIYLAIPYDSEGQACGSALSDEEGDYIAISFRYRCVFIIRLKEGDVVRFLADELMYIFRMISVYKYISREHLKCDLLVDAVMPLKLDPVWRPYLGIVIIGYQLAYPVYEVLFPAR